MDNTIAIKAIELALDMPPKECPYEDYFYEKDGCDGCPAFDKDDGRELNDGCTYEKSYAYCFLKAAEVSTLG